MDAGEEDYQKKGKMSLSLGSSERVYRIASAGELLWRVSQPSVYRIHFSLQSLELKLRF
jgi:hypothetical protein